MLFALFKDKDCLTTVLEVVELGVSGTKSVGKPGEPIKMKDEKELKPASMRVRDAADALLTILLEQVCIRRISVRVQKPSIIRFAQEKKKPQPHNNRDNRREV